MIGLKEDQTRERVTKKNPTQGDRGGVEREIITKSFTSSLYLGVPVFHTTKYIIVVRSIPQL
jgi:hypothetical protein